MDPDGGKWRSHQRIVIAGFAVMWLLTIIFTAFIAYEMGKESTPVQVSKAPASSYSESTSRPASTPTPIGPHFNHVTKIQAQSSFQKFADFHFYTSVADKGRTATIGKDPDEAVIVEFLGRGPKIEQAQLIASPYWNDQTYIASIMLYFTVTFIPEWEGALDWLYDSATKIEQGGGEQIATRDGKRIKMKLIGDRGEAQIIQILIWPQ